MDILRVAQLIDPRYTRYGRHQCFDASNHQNGDKSPSMDLKRNGSFHCTPCGMHGGPLDMFMRATGQSLPKAMESLCRQFNITIQHETDNAPVKAPIDHEHFGRLAGTMHRLLLKSQEHGMWRDYLKSRQVTPEMVRENCLGAWMPDFDKSIFHFDQNPRIIFPIYDDKGRVIGFYGRALEGEGFPNVEKPSRHRFTQGFEKQATIYRMANLVASKQKRAIIVEGHFDAIMPSLDEEAVVVGCQGTSGITLSLIQRFPSTTEIRFLLDMDKGGVKAMAQAYVSSLILGRMPRFYMLPEKLDLNKWRQSCTSLDEYRNVPLVTAPDFFARKGNEELSYHFFTSVMRLVKEQAPESLTWIASVLSRELDIRLSEWSDAGCPNVDKMYTSYMAKNPGAQAAIDAKAAYDQATKNLIACLSRAEET
ncbi:MAG: hypothetical protein ACRCWR_02530 [Saezia sp.]